MIIRPRLSRCRREIGMTLIELCIVMLILGILMVLAVAMFNRARMAGNESAAMASLRATNSAQFAYLNGCGHGGYATSFVILGTKAAGNSQGYITEDLGAALNPIRNGYRFALATGAQGGAAPADCNGRVTQTRYYATAIPIAQGKTGSRTFATSQAGAVWQSNGPIPPDEPFGPPEEKAQ